MLHSSDHRPPVASLHRETADRAGSASSGVGRRADAGARPRRASRGCLRALGACLVAAALWAGSGGGSLALAQDAPAPTADDAPTTDLTDAAATVPLVDEPAPPAPREVIANATLALYDLVLDHHGDCASLAVKLDTFLDENAGAVEEASQAIAADAANMTDEDIAALGAYFAETITRDPRTAAAQEALYPCLRSYAGQTRHTRVDRKMQRFFELHQAMISALVGNVD